MQTTGNGLLKLLISPQILTAQAAENDVMYDRDAVSYLRIIQKDLIQV